MDKVRIYTKSILIPLIIGGVVGLITAPSMMYNNLKQPSFAPPGFLFPIVWTILYTLMGISYGILESNNLTDKETDQIYYAQLFVNALWSIIFFVLEWRLVAFVWIILLAVLIVVMIKKFYKKNQVAALLQIPYLLWVLFAAYLNLSIYLLNR